MIHCIFQCIWCLLRYWKVSSILWTSILNQRLNEILSCRNWCAKLNSNRFRIFFFSLRKYHSYKNCSILKSVILFINFHIYIYMILLFIHMITFSHFSDYDVSPDFERYNSIISKKVCKVLVHCKKIHKELRNRITHLLSKFNMQT